MVLAAAIENCQLELAVSSDCLLQVRHKSFIQLDGLSTDIGGFHYRYSISRERYQSVGTKLQWAFVRLVGIVEVNRSDVTR